MDYRKSYYEKCPDKIETSYKWGYDNIVCYIITIYRLLVEFF